MEAVTVSEHLSSWVQNSDGLTLRLGTELGSLDGCNEVDGSFEGIKLGLSDGEVDGIKLGGDEGSDLGSSDGSFDGSNWW